MTRGVQSFALLLTVLATTSLTNLAYAQAAPVQAAAPAAQPAGRGIGIAATVNDEPITMSDIDNRVDLYLLGSQGTPPQNVRDQLSRQILGKLIDEKLQIQAGKSLGITIGDDQVMDAFVSVSEKNHLTADEFKARLAAQGIKVQTLYDQLRAEIAWGQVIRRKLRPQINISEPEIESEFDQIEQARTSTPAPAAETPAVAAPEAVPAPVSAPAGAAPQKTDFVALKQIMIPLTPEDSADVINAKMARAVAVQTSVKSCAAFEAEMKNFQNPGTLDMGRGPVIALPPALQALIRPLTVGIPSAPIRTGDGRGIAVLIVCEKTQEALPATATAAPAVAPAPVAEAAPAAKLDRSNQADREAIANKLGLDRLNKLADRYLRDLRATAYIDKRI